MIIGQKKLLNKLDSFNLDTFPHSTLFIGEKGSGKHTIVNYISENIIKLPIIDISETISYDYIDLIYRNPNPFIYLIDINKMTEKEQNILLKFVEEPLKNAYIMLLCDNANLVLNTLYTRCRIFELDSYSKEELEQFISEKENKDLITSILRTPGKILNTNLSNISEIYNLCNTIVDKINIANFSNTLSIVDKLNYKDEYNKFDLDIFFDTLVYTLYNKYLIENNKRIFNMYLLTIDERKKLVDKRLNKEVFVQNFLTKLWKESRI